MCVSTYRSPAGPPPLPGSPFPLKRILPPSLAPAGILTVTGLTFTTLPLPRHVVHGVSTTLPLPPHRLHGRDTPKRPCPWLTWPVPLHTGHVFGLVPGAAPLPWHVGHDSTRWTSTFVVTPSR